MPRKTHIHTMLKDVYSTVDIAIKASATAVTAPSIHCGPKRLSVLDDTERLAGVDGAATVTFRSGRVGSMFGVVDIRNIGGRGEPSNWYKLR